MSNVVETTTKAVSTKMNVYSVRLNLIDISIVSSLSQVDSNKNPTVLRADKLSVVETASNFTMEIQSKKEISKGSIVCYAVLPVIVYYQLVNFHVRKMPR